MNSLSFFIIPILLLIAQISEANVKLFNCGNNIVRSQALKTKVLSLGSEALIIPGESNGFYYLDNESLKFYILKSEKAFKTGKLFDQFKFSLAGSDNKKRFPIHYYLNKSKPGFASNIVVKKSKDITQYPILKTSKRADKFEDRVFIEDVFKRSLARASKEIGKYSDEIKDQGDLLSMGIDLKGDLTNSLKGVYCTCSKVDRLKKVVDSSPELKEFKGQCSNL